LGGSRRVTVAAPLVVSAHIRRLSAANLHQISLTRAFATLTFIRAVSRKKPSYSFKLTKACYGDYY
jgi:hypothetical protein